VLGFGSPCVQGEPAGGGSGRFPPLREGNRAGKGTTVWHEVFEAGAIFPSASVNGQAHCIALTPFVPLSRGAGEGERAAGRTAVRPYTPLPQRGRGAGGEGEKSASVPHAANPSAVPLSAPNLPRTRGRNSLPACGEGWGGGYV